jgi:hypothetical protein
VIATTINAVAMMPNMAPAPCWFNTGSKIKGNMPLTMRDNEYVLPMAVERTLAGKISDW